MLEYDYVVVGGGSAGAAAAARLAEQTGDATVCLVEAGPTDEGNRRVRSLRSWLSLHGSELDWNYTLQPQEYAREGMRLHAGRVLGGSSAISGGVAFRTPEADLQAWEDAGATGWGPSGTRPFLDSVLERLPVELPRETSPTAAAFVDAAGEAGFPLVEFTVDVETGVGWFWRTAQGEDRQSSAAAYLRPRPSGLVVLTRTVARRIRLDRERAIGVDTARGPIRARREVILCCGAIQTPRLLMVSGIGPREHLASLGVRVVADVPGVGEGFVDRPSAVVTWETREPVHSATPLWEAGLLVPGLQLHVAPWPFDEVVASLGYPTSDSSITVSARVASPRSRGSVRLSSGDPRAPMLLDPAYFTDPDGHDEQTLARGLELARTLAEQPALAALLKAELAPGRDVSGADALGEYARTACVPANHAGGTCRMGAPDDPDAVVDPELRVKGIEGLRIADASVFPTMVSVDPALTCMTVGERCAAFAAAAAR